MQFKSIYPLGIFSVLLFLSSCSDSSKIKGEWVRSDYKSTLKITDEKVIFDNITEREYEVGENTLKVIAYGIATDYQFDFKGDTLVLTKGTSVQKFVPKDKVSSDEEQIKVLLTPQVEKMFEKKIANLTLEKEHWGDLKEKITLQKVPSIPDDEWVYSSEITFEDKMTPPATIFVRAGRDKSGVLKPAWTEILESSTRRYLINGMGIPAEKVDLKPTGGNGYDVTVTTNDGSTLPILLDPQIGVLPRQDESSISTYFQYSLQKKYGKDLIKRVDLKQDDVFYKGTVTLSNGTQIPTTYSKVKGLDFTELDQKTKEALGQGMIESELNVELEWQETEIVGDLLKMTFQTAVEEKLVTYVDVMRGWYPENTLTSLSTATRYRIQKKVGSTNKVGSVILAQRSQERYEGTVDFASGSVERIIVEHTGTGFSWRAATEQDKYLK
ncbi:MAG: hypothetical protein COZ18_13960 [Flexibacter sp. CG_4_10_14_3_um_filter_32_15]|nr:MAG: hypothetical protein COZ18_13960 [Flexibacter sp. CG_4_10_14_3_um_filter_32_15]